nr:MAG TPA: hypothetical protein [Bacteriophage sp.]
MQIIIIYTQNRHIEIKMEFLKIQIKIQIKYKTIIQKVFFRDIINLQFQIILMN